MDALRRSIGIILLGGVAGLALAGCQAPSPVAAVPPSPPSEQGGSDPQLEQLLAPVALYPDPLLAQVLMASTYPLEVVQAQRWLERGGNAGLRGETLAQVLDAEPWDASVKSLVPFPDVLNMMAEQLEWTQQLGDAVLERPEAVLASVQTLRRRAQAAGMLKSTPQQTVNTSGTVVAIESAQPDVVYVPVYDTRVVYGAWPYPAYPPYYYPLGGAVVAGLAFATAVAVVGGYWGWARPGWGGGDIDIDVDRTRNVNIDRGGAPGGRWQHRVEHRQGVPYRSDAVRSRFQGDRPQPRAGAAGRPPAQRTGARSAPRPTPRPSAGRAGGGGRAARGGRR